MTSRYPENTSKQCRELSENKTREEAVQFILSFIDSSNPVDQDQISQAIYILGRVFDLSQNDTELQGAAEIAEKFISTHPEAWGHIGQIVEVILPYSEYLSDEFRVIMIDCCKWTCRAIIYQG